MVLAIRRHFAHLLDFVRVGHALHRVADPITGLARAE